MILRIIAPEEVPTLRRDPVDAETLATTAPIVDGVRAEGDAGLRRFAEKFGDLESDQLLVVDQGACKSAFETLPEHDQTLLTRTAQRIRTFAQAQLDSASSMVTSIPGGRAGHDMAPMERAGCYAPGGRFPLPSSVLMTAVTARTAGVRTVWVASPKPSQMTLAAAHVARADAVLAVGGAQAIAALAYGTETVPACDVIVGPGNRWVTAAKQLVAGRVAIDMLAGPSELVVLADDSADVELVAADLLAQAEHDPDAVPILVTTSREHAEQVNDALDRQLEDLPTREIAAAACANGFAVVCEDTREAAKVCDQLAPEHLEVLTRNPRADARNLDHFGGLFIGPGSAEVLGDYGIGPNHVLPTGGTARSTGGLSVFDFVRWRTWMEVEDLEAARGAVRDAVSLARHEGLEAHARSAEKRLPGD